VVELVQLYLVAVAISLDTFAAAIALGTRTAPAGWIRVAAVFAVAGGLFPLVGMWVGLLASGLLTQVAGGVGALVLAGLGGWFLHGALTGGDAPLPGHIQALKPEMPLGGLVLLSMGLSSDNLLVGLGLGLQGGMTLLLGALTAFSVFCATLTGLWLGRMKKLWFGRAAEGLAGVLLLGLAAYLLLAAR
jgi:manganese efflux pump family protein